MTKRIKISNHEIATLLGSEPAEFPKYATQILNLANQNSQGTRPAVVGQMTELIQAFSGKSISEWEKWYLAKYPDAIEEAKCKIKDMLEKLKQAITLIDDKMIEDWVKDLVIIKTYIGLKFQEAILSKVAAISNKPYRSATTSEESKGIDGIIGDTPVSIKPSTYKTKDALAENITAKMIYYEKAKDGITINIESLFEAEN